MVVLGKKGGGNKGCLHKSEKKVLFCGDNVEQYTLLDIVIKHINWYTYFIKQQDAIW